MIGCDVCDDNRWMLLDEEEEIGFIYGPCPKCCWLPRAPASLPAPVDALVFVSDSKRIRLGVEYEWAQHGPAW